MMNMNSFLDGLNEKQKSAVLACKTEAELERVIDDYDIELPDELLSEVAGGKGKLIPLLLAGLLTLSAVGSTAEAAESRTTTQDTGILREVEADSSSTAGFVEFQTDRPEIATVTAKGNTALDRYLKSIAPKDKKTLLIDKGEGSNLETIGSVEEEGNNLIVVTRKRESLENSTETVGTLAGNLSGVYPGAIVHADSNLVDGHPTAITIDGVDRQPMRVYLDIAGNTLPAHTVDYVSEEDVLPEINKMLEDWLQNTKTVPAQISYKCVMAHSKSQLDMALGVKGAADKYGVDINACMKGEKQEMLVVFNQIYYTVKTNHATASKLFAKNVDENDLIDEGVDASNPCLAEVTSMSYGRQIVVKLSTENTSAEVEAAWNASLGSTEIKNENAYKEIMEKTSISACAFGGNPGTVGGIMSAHTIEEINEALKQDLQFSEKTPAVPLSYSTTFIDDGSSAMIVRSTDYITTKRTVRGPVSFKVSGATWWDEKEQHLYGRRVVGVDEKGNLKLSGWETLNSDTGSVSQQNISGKYVEFGFEVDQTGATDWPYSDVFWRYKDGVVNSIDIDLGGAARKASINIKVNGNSVFQTSNADSHSRHNWNEYN